MFLERKVSFPIEEQIRSFRGTAASYTYKSATRAATR